jgi:ADP-heptose:LPS heptosyltransferase
MRLSAMGDVAMIVPVLRALVNQNKEIQITVISRPFFKPFFNGIPNLTFFAFDDKKRHKGFLGLIRLFRDLQQLKIEAFADLHNVLRSKVIGLLFALSGKKTAKVNKARAEKKALTRAENKIFEPLTPIIERHLKVFKQLGFDIDLSNPIFPKKSILDAQTFDLIQNQNQKLIGIAPFAQYPSKVYPLDLILKVINKLTKDTKNKVLLFGGKEDISLLNLLENNNKEITIVAGKLKFEQELQLISNLDVMLSMDSGNAHIAAMLGVKVVTLWGATHPFAGFAPFNQPLENALVSDRNKFPKLPTSIYGNKKIEGYDDAMRTILPETVVAKIDEIIS